MRRFYNPIKDASIYSEFPQKNSGLDEILEVGKSLDGLNSIRSLIQFDINAISASIQSGIIPPSASFDLKLYLARADDLQYGQTIELHPVSQSWVEGTGYFYQNSNVPFTSSRNPTGGYFENDGVTWKNRFSASIWNNSGSDFVTLSSSVTLAQPVTDVLVDVTSIIGSMISGTYVGGLVLKFPDADELNNRIIGDTRFFSRNTHTIYAPILVAKWNDQVYVTGSISASDIPSELSVLPRNLRPHYIINESVRVDLSVRDQYPIKTFDTTFSAFAGNQRLPSSSYFSIIDQQSNTTIIPFDDYSRVNSDGSGSYVNFRIEGVSPGRYYKLIIKVVDGGYEQIFDNAHIFTVDAAAL